MSTTLTVELTEEVKATLGKAAREEGVSENVFVARALQDYLFLRRFRKLSERMIAESGTSYTDEEVFGIVSKRSASVHPTSFECCVIRRGAASPQH